MRLKKQKTISQAEIDAAAEKYKTEGGKQVIGHARVQHPGEPAVTKYTLEDGSELMELDDGTPVQDWPELPQAVIDKRAEK